MAAKTFEEWDCIKDCEVEDRQCSMCEAAWKAATLAAEEKFTSANTDSPKLLDELIEIRELIKEKSYYAAINNLTREIEQLRASVCERCITFCEE